MARIENRIRPWRKTRKLTLKQLAERLGVSTGNLHKWETGKVPITLDRLADIARALDCKLIDLIQEPALVPLVGTIGPGGKVLLSGDAQIGRKPRTVRCPAELDARLTVAIEVVGDSMLPIVNGWLLFYSHDYAEVPYELVGKLCVVQLADDGPRYVKRVTLGRHLGLFNLYSVNVRELEDVPLAWAAPILLTRPRRPDDDVA